MVDDMTDFEILIVGYPGISGKLPGNFSQVTREFWILVAAAVDFHQVRILVLGGYPGILVTREFLKGYPGILATREFRPQRIQRRPRRRRPRHSTPTDRAAPTDTLAVMRRRCRARNHSSRQILTENIMLHTTLHTNQQSQTTKTTTTRRPQAPAAQKKSQTHIRQRAITLAHTQKWPECPIGGGGGGCCEIPG